MAKYPDVTAGQVEACINRMGGMNKFLRYIRGEGKLQFEPLFRDLSTFSIPALPPFNPQDYFRTPTGGENGGVKIASIPMGFLHDFVSDMEPTKPASFVARELLLRSTTKTVIGEMVRPCTISLAQLWACLERQGHGQVGDLQTNGRENIFLVRDKDHTPRTVEAEWSKDHDGWFVHVGVILDSGGAWAKGARLIFRN